MAAPNWRSFIADAANFFSLLAALIVEQPARNPYWLALKARFPQKCFLSRSAMTCLKIFPTVSSMQSGRNEAGFPTGLPGFCNNTSQATFHRVGNIPLFNNRLNTASSIPELARCTMVHTMFGIPSGPGAFLALARTRSTTTSISSAVNSGGPSSSSRGVTTSAGRRSSSGAMYSWSKQLAVHELHSRILWPNLILICCYHPCYPDCSCISLLGRRYHLWWTFIDPYSIFRQYSRKLRTSRNGLSHVTICSHMSTKY